MDEQVHQITDQDTAVAQQTIEDLLDRLHVSGSVRVESNENMFDVILETEESGIVIGYHGEALEALQLIFSLMVSKKIGSFVRVNLEVGDYKKNRSEYLERLAMQTKEIASETQLRNPQLHLFLFYRS